MRNKGGSRPLWTRSVAILDDGNSLASANASTRESSIASKIYWRQTRYIIVIFVTRATRAFLVETAQVLEAEPLGEARDARRDKKPFARVPKVILCVPILKS